MKKHQDSDAIYYFGYGPMVHPSVRQRRRVAVRELQPAVLPEYRMTFAFGGVASVVKQRGYDVHGVVMRCESAKDWEIMKEFEEGYYAAEVEVFPYNLTEVNNSLSSIRAYVFVMLEFDEDKLETPIEKLPQERYLRLLASGMRTYGLDEDYIQDQIMGVPFVPSRKPSEYLTFPVLPLFADEAFLPRITFERYQRLCQRSDGHIFFIVGRHVVLVGNHDPSHPGAMWFERFGYGQGDVTFRLHQTIVDPDIPFCATRDDITAETQAWAENHLVEFIAQCGFTAHRVLSLDGTECDDEAIERLLKMFQTGCHSSENCLSLDASPEHDDEKLLQHFDEHNDQPEVHENGEHKPLGQSLRKAFKRLSFRRGKSRKGDTLVVDDPEGAP